MRAADVKVGVTYKSLNGGAHRRVLHITPEREIVYEQDGWSKRTTMGKFVKWAAGRVGRGYNLRKN